MIRVPRSVFIATITTTLSAAAVLAAFLVSTVTVSVDVSENIILDSPATIEITLFPSETQEINVVLRNIGSVAQAVEIEAKLTSPGNGIEITTPGLTVVPGDGLQYTFVVTIEAEGDVDVAMHTVAIEIERK